MVVVQQYGCHVITSAVAHWLVANHISPNDFDISQISTETAAQCRQYNVLNITLSNVIVVAGQIYLQQLCSELQFTLNRQELLTHVIWDIVCTYNNQQVQLIRM